MTDAAAIAVGACIGSGITGIVAIVSNILQRRSDERRQIRELAVQVAIENWKHSFEIAKARSQVATITISPLDLYIIHAANLVKTLDGRNRNPEEIADLLRKGNELTGAAKEEVQKHTDQVRNYKKT